MKRKIILIISFVLFLSGCTENHSKNDIKKYVENELNLKNIKISKNYKKLKDDEGYTDKLWTVVDKKNNITFHVLDDYYYGGESVTNSLKNDYDNTVFINYYNKLKLQDNIIYNEEKKDGLEEVLLTCNYKNKNELKKCYDSLISYNEYFKNKGFDLEIRYNVKLDFSIRKNVEEEIEDGDSTWFINSLNTSSYDKMIFQYLKCGLIYQIEDIVNEMTEAEMQKIMDDKETYRVYKINEKNEKIYYNDIIGRYGNITFGSLYKLLKLEKFNVSGNANHFTVVNKNGDKYEFSYQFNNEYNEKSNKNGYYYLKNGNKVQMQSYFYNYFSQYEIKDMFNINIEIECN